MIDIKKIGAIDIGSNAIRLLINNVFENGTTVFNKDGLYRVPVRLGEDAFDNGKISERNIERLINTMISFKHLLAASEVSHYRACATSALRTASNSEEIIEKIKQESGIEIDLISGEEEAKIIFSTQIINEMKADKTYMFVDVGGGSTEVTFFKDGEKATSGSFKVGTVRLLLDKVEKETWQEMTLWVKKNALNFSDIKMIGSGGNITRLFKMSMKEKFQALTFNEIHLHYKYLSHIKYEDRIKVLGLKPDRADVIIHATKIYMKVMENAGVDKVYVPKLGLADGIVKDLYNKIKR